MSAINTSTVELNSPGFQSGSYVNAVVTQLSHPWTFLATLLAIAVTYDQVMYIWRKGNIVGPTFKIPFMGPFIYSINPVFTEYIRQWASGPLSCVSIFHKFVVIASTRDMARKVFNSPTFVKPCLVDVAKELIRADNWVFLDGKEHVDYRKGLNGLFTRQALDAYLPRQEEVYSIYFEKFSKMTEANGGKPLAYLHALREFQTALACRTFVGFYVTEAEIKQIADDYYKITAAMDLVNFPWILPFSRPWYGKKAASMVIRIFSKCATKSKVRMAAGGEVSCILDAWVKHQIDSAKYRKDLEDGVPAEELVKPPMLIREFNDHEIALTFFSFLFASQDATSSANCWLFQVTAQRPDVLDKIREENLRVRGGDRNVPVSMDLLDQMPYTRAAVKELLRYRPPVIMVPYQAKKDFPVTDSYTVPKGSMIIPSVYPALHDPEIYPNPDHYDPDRWITGDAEQQVKNWLVFGTGPHYCLGQIYAIANLMAMIGRCSMFYDWKHHATERSEEIKVFACLFPMDGTNLTFERREE